MWQLPIVQALMRRMRKVHIDFCAWGARTRGATTWATDLENLRLLARRCPGPSATHRHAPWGSKTWDHTTGRLAPTTALAAEPPKSLCTNLRNIVHMAVDFAAPATPVLAPPSPMVPTWNPHHGRLSMIATTRLGSTSAAVHPAFTWPRPSGRIRIPWRSTDATSA